MRFRQAGDYGHITAHVPVVPASAQFRQNVPLAQGWPQISA